MRVGKRGIALHLVIALFVSVIIMGTTYILGSSRTMGEAPLLIRLKAGYHMESSLLLLQNRLRAQAPGFSNADATLGLSRREIAPGVTLTTRGQRTGTSSFRLESRVEGAGLERILEAELHGLPPTAGLEPPSVSPSASATGPWLFQYLVPERLEP